MNIFLSLKHYFYFIITPLFLWVVVGKFMLDHFLHAKYQGLCLYRFPNKVTPSCFIIFQIAIIFFTDLKNNIHRNLDRNVKSFYNKMQLNVISNLRSYLIGVNELSDCIHNVCLKSVFYYEFNSWNWNATKNYTCKISNMAC